MDILDLTLLDLGLDIDFRILTLDLGLSKIQHILCYNLNQDPASKVPPKTSKKQALTFQGITGRV